jgi:hypothetical protein
MYAPVKPAKVSVYVKLDSVMVESSVSLVQLRFGQVAFASKAASVGTGPDWSCGTASLPFFGLSLPVVVGAVWVWDLTSTIWPPWLRHWTVAEYVAFNVAVAFALPTPASSYGVHVTRPVELTEQLIEPVWRCVPVGAFARTMVVVIAARAAGALTRSATVNTVAVIPIRFNIITPLVGGKEVPSHGNRLGRLGGVTNPPFGGYSANALMIAGRALSLDLGHRC